jgi:type IV pilus assembly protein PilC
MLFQYKALLNNKPVEGIFEAMTEKEVLDYLKTNGYFPLSVKEKRPSILQTILHHVQQISFTDITYMTRQFAIMLNAGLTLIDSLEILKKQASKMVMKDMLADIDKTLREGKSFSQALAKYPKYFSHFYVALVKSGEASGKLDIILVKLAENLEFQKEFKSKIKNALIYPVVIISAMVAMIFVLLTFVVPRLTELYDNFQIELPDNTKRLIAVSSFLEAYWIYVIVGVVVVIIGLLRFGKTPRGKRIFDTIVLYIPVFGNVIKTAALVDATRTLSILIGSGVPILDGLAIVVDVNSNVLFKDAFQRVRDKVEKGLSIGGAMSSETIFPDSLIQMTIVGQQTGHLDETLVKISDYYQTESEIAVKALLTLIEPLILIVLGVTVGFLVMSVITPIFSLTSSLQ